MPQGIAELRAIGDLSRLSVTPGSAVQILTHRGENRPFSVNESGDVPGQSTPLLLPMAALRPAGCIMQGALFIAFEMGNTIQLGVYSRETGQPSRSPVSVTVGSAPSLIVADTDALLLSYIADGAHRYLMSRNAGSTWSTFATADPGRGFLTALDIGVSDPSGTTIIWAQSDDV